MKIKVIFESLLYLDSISYLVIVERINQAVTIVEIIFGGETTIRENLEINNPNRTLLSDRLTSAKSSILVAVRLMLQLNLARWL